MKKTDAVTVANAKAKRLQSSLPRVVSARYDRRIERVVLHLSTGIDLAFPPHIAQGLEEATPSQLGSIEISPSGFGIHFPRLDADIYLPAMLEGFLGSRHWMARRLGAQGGKATSSAKSAAAKKNGRLGGRPRKAAAVA